MTDEPLRIHRWECLSCPHLVSAMTEMAAVEAMAAHRDYAHARRPS